MHITNKEIIKHLFQRTDIHHVTIATNDFGTYANAMDDKCNIIESLNDINITIDNENFVITEYNKDFNVSNICTIPLIWLIK